MINLKFSMKRTVDVNKGLASNWQRTFQNDDIRVPEGWVHSLEVNGRMYRFSFATVSNAKIPFDTYIIVIDAFSRAEVLGREPRTEERWYVVPVMSVLRPEQEGKMLCVDEYLHENAVATFTKDQKEQWVKEKKMVVR